VQLPCNTGIEPGAWWTDGRLAITTQPSDGAIVGQTLQGIITSWSRAAERLYGYAAAEVIGKPIALLAPPERRDELLAMLSAAGLEAERVEPVGFGPFAPAGQPLLPERAMIRLEAALQHRADRGAPLLRSASFQHVVLARVRG